MSRPSRPGRPQRESVGSRHRLSLALPLAAALALAACDGLIPTRSPGARIYRSDCASCHGLDGRGNTVKYMGNAWADLGDDAWRHGGSPSAIEHTLRTEAVFEHPSFDHLDRQEIRQVVDHLLELRGKRR